MDFEPSSNEVLIIWILNHHQMKFSLSLLYLLSIELSQLGGNFWAYVLDKWKLEIK